MKFLSVLEEKSIDQLENLLFFNPQQIRYIQEIVQTVNQYGKPRIIKTNRGLSIAIDNIYDLQNLFFLDKNDKLIGVAMYYLEDKTTVTLLHIAICDEYNSQNNPEYNTFIKVVSRIVKSLRLIKGVERLKILYSDKVSFINIR